MLGNILDGGNREAIKILEVHVRVRVTVLTISDDGSTSNIEV